MTVSKCHIETNHAQVPAGDGESFRETDVELHCEVGLSLQNGTGWLWERRLRFTDGERYRTEL